MRRRQRAGEGGIGRMADMRKSVRPSTLLTLLAVLAVLLYLALAAVFHLPAVWLVILLVPLIALTLVATYVRSRRERGR